MSADDTGKRVPLLGLPRLGPIDAPPSQPSGVVTPTDQELIDEARFRYQRDAEFHYRVHASAQALSLMFPSWEMTPQKMSVLLLLDEKIRRANDLRA